MAGPYYPEEVQLPPAPVYDRWRVLPPPHETQGRRIAALRPIHVFLFLATLVTTTLSLLAIYVLAAFAPQLTMADYFLLPVGAAKTAHLRVLLVVQFALWQHAVHVAGAAAQEGARAARLEGGTAAAGQAEAEQFLARLGPGFARRPTQPTQAPPRLAAGLWRDTTLA